jgi:oxazoline/thiazoline synthase
VNGRLPRLPRLRAPVPQRGPLLRDLLPLLDGRHSVGDILRTLAGHHDAAEVLYGLVTLRDAGCLTPDAGGSALSQDARPAEPSWADAFLATHARLVDAATGVATEIRVVTPAEDPVQIAITIPPSPRGRFSVTGPSSGKGRTVSEARASALAEAAERASIANRDAKFRIRASERELGASAFGADACLQYSARQYQIRGLLNRLPWETARVPRRASADRPLWWVRVTRFGTTEYRYVPLAYAYLDRVGADRAYCLADSNGCASGKTANDAMLRAILELIERDAVGIWWYNRLHQPRVDIDTHGNDFDRGLVEHYHRRGRQVWALDLTTDLQVPVVAAISRRRDAGSERISVGFGCGLTNQEALGRALAEMHQVTVLFAEYPHPQHIPMHLRRWLAATTTRQHPYLTAHDRPMRSKQSSFLLSVDDAPRVSSLVSHLRSLGYDVFTLDQTHRDIGVSVWRAIVPGLCHFWPRFGVARLIRTPVQMSRLRRPRQERELNPVPIFF